MKPNKYGVIRKYCFLFIRRSLVRAQVEDSNSQMKSLGYMKAQPLFLSATTKVESLVVSINHQLI